MSAEQLVASPRGLRRSFSDKSGVPSTQFLGLVEFPLSAFRFPLFPHRFPF
jgi:hypothetical protein